MQNSSESETYIINIDSLDLKEYELKIFEENCKHKQVNFL